MAHDSKSCRRASVSWVRIPLSPLTPGKNVLSLRCLPVAVVHRKRVVHLDGICTYDYAVEDAAEENLDLRAVRAEE